MKPALEVLPTAALASQAAADRFTVAAGDAIRARGRFVVALSGGSTPLHMYERIAAGAHASAVDWTRVQVLWSDERCVPSDDAQSNYRMARETLLDHVPIPQANVHRVRGEDEPVEAASAYEGVLRRVLATSAERPGGSSGGRVDLVLLGLGEDGHTASLFPGMVDVHESQHWVRAVHAPAVVPPWRVTFTPAAINAAVAVDFLVTGSAKAAIVRDVLEGLHRPHELPAQLVAAASGRVTWVLDAAAAAGLRKA